MERSKESALLMLLGLRQAIANEVTDAHAAKLLTDDLVRSVFAQAWKNQFDEARGGFRTTVKQLVSDAIESSVLSEGDQ